MSEQEFNSEEEVWEVKGRDGEWKIFYPDEGDIQTPFPVYDKEGKLKTVIFAGGSSGKLTELNEEFPNAKAAAKHAKELGAQNIKLTKTKAKIKKVINPL